MIKLINETFVLNTKKTTYLFGIDKFKHLNSIYYGKLLPLEDDYSFAKSKDNPPQGTSTTFDEASNYSLDMLYLELSTYGKGDYSFPSILIKGKEGFISDFTYVSYKIDKSKDLEILPSPKEGLEELVIYLTSNTLEANLELHYLVDEENDIILRNLVIIAKKDIEIKKAMSMQLDFVNQNYKLVTFHGAWSNEMNKDISPISHGTHIIDSKMGLSSNRYNPFFMIVGEKTNEVEGEAYAFNLIYSGNHMELVERTNYDKLRLQIGINPFLFNEELKEGESFITPYAVMTYSASGLETISENMHSFIRGRMLRHPLSYPPILVNNWEATYARFNEANLHHIISKAKKLGLEMFVLDDGWFSNRNDDSHGLGDYDINRHKLPHGLKGLSSYCRRKGLSFGLWFEPECVNPDSKLYKEHPSWIIKMEGVSPSKGRHQYVLDLTKDEVISYIVSSMNEVLDSAPISYVKWDMNRPLSDVPSYPGSFIHRYYLGFYTLCRKIILTHPDIYFEGCASGGNRFDLGILRYFDQIWSSDDTDAIERIRIQSNLSIGYPLRCISNHASAPTSQALCRSLPLSTRINVALFGAFGFEMNLSHLTKHEIEEAKEAVKFYKEHRDTFVNGKFYRLKEFDLNSYGLWLVVSSDKSEAILGYFNGVAKLNSKDDIISLRGLDEEAKYSFSVVPIKHEISRFGTLINTILPFNINERGSLARILSNFATIPAEKESYILSGKSLTSGALRLTPIWRATGISDSVRTIFDFGSRIYLIKKIDQ